MVPVVRGLEYYEHTGGEQGLAWSGKWHATNVKLGRQDPFWDIDYVKSIVGKIHLHWRLGEGQYVQWDYVLENGEPVMIWPENNKPVNWLSKAPPKC